MATVIGNELRIGVGAIEIDTEGEDFTTPLLDLGRCHPDGIVVTYEKPFQEIGSGQSPQVEDIYDIALERLEFTWMAKTFSEKILLLSLGRDITDFTDNTTGTPPDLNVTIGGWNYPTYYALRIKAPQPATPTLFDIIHCYRVRFVAAYGVTKTYNNERYLPLRAICTRDLTLGSYCKKIIEGAAGT